MITPDRCNNVQAQESIMEENNKLQSHVKLIPKVKCGLFGKKILRKFVTSMLQ